MLVCLSSVESPSICNGIRLGDAFAKGAWLEETVSPSDWPEALDPLAIIIGLGMGEISVKTRETD